VSSALLASIPGRFTPDPPPTTEPAPEGALELAPPGAATTKTDQPHEQPREPTWTARHHASLRAEIADGLRWLTGHRLLRTLAVMAAIQQLGLATWSSILVLFAQDRLGLGNVAYGLLWTGVAAGSLLGSLLAARLSRALGTGRALLASASTLGATTLAIGATTDPWAAGSLLGVLGMALTVWNVVAVSLRQAIIPDRLVGRVNSVFQQLSLGILPVGAALGGVLGHTLGLRAPFLISGAVLLITALLAVPIVTNRAIQAARTAAR
jgi:predicted MFS family arabinose efflux permease